VFHVNGDDPEAVAWVMELALRYRQQFSADAVVDMYCYRRHGHNEVDEPSFTQPALYRKIDAHPLVSQIYAGRLRAAGELDEAAERAMREKHPAELEREFRDFGSVSEDGVESWKARFHGSNAVYQPAYSHAPVDTGVGRDKLDHVAKAICGVPPGFAPNPKILRLLETRRQLLESEGLVDWPFAESLAWGTLLLDGIPVRLSGQDVARGTFSQRHAVLYDNETQDAHIPLMHMEGRMADICIHNSLLSEAAVLGFDYGYSLDFPRMLCIWEAQFGDFANGAQVIIDQFISASESKWQRISGLVMLLPHGYEGQGPEHSHARLERFLQLCAEDNLQVCNLTTPAQYFHALRRQMLRDFRKPLIVMSPKSLLRSKDCRSHIGEFTDGIFHGILDDPSPPSAPERVVFCSGKVFYDLVAYRRENPALAGSTCIMRIEQLYPLDELEIRRLMDARCVGVRTVVWCQEEPRNMGAWSFITPRLERITGMRPVFAGRKESASPAVGSLTLHKKEQATLVEAAFSVH
jgi:2-oxoglutarate dehydrogenase E1 component